MIVDVAQAQWTQLLTNALSVAGLIHTHDKYLYKPYRCLSQSGHLCLYAYHALLHTCFISYWGISSVKFFQSDFFKYKTWQTTREKVSIFCQIIYNVNGWFKIDDLVYQLFAMPVSPTSQHTGSLSCLHYLNRVSSDVSFVDVITNTRNSSIRKE